MPEPDGAGTLICVGTSHRVAPVPFIERALRGAERFRDAWLHAHGAGATPSTRELVLLATCNRVELWAAVPDSDATRTSAAMRSALAGDEDCGDQVYAISDSSALRHLCRVTAGLDSMVIGEPQIAGQVARAFDSVLHANGGAPVLAAAARTARIASRRARSLTGISRGAASLSTVAVHVAAERLGSLPAARVLVIGAGKIGRLACQALRDSGADVTIVNRTAARAETLAARVGARARPLDELDAALAECDVIIASTASPHPILDAATFRRVRAGSSERTPLLVIDIAVPRNVSADVADVDGITLLDIDDLRRRVRAHLDERCAEIPRAEAIIDGVLAEHAGLAPRTLEVIAELRRRAERIRKRVVRRTLADLGDTDPTTRERIEHLSRTLVNHLLHDPTARLRDAAVSDAGDRYAVLARQLFALDGEASARAR